MCRQFLSKPLRTSVAVSTKLSSHIVLQVRLHGHDWVRPLPATVLDPGGKDLAGIPRLVADIQQRWASGCDLNNITAWCFGRALTKRVQQRLEEPGGNALDILITGQVRVSMHLLGL
jgi:hypothetical protein